MRGLKLVTMYAKVNNIESHLLQMRGLKLYQGNWDICIRRSHLLQMRGLKQLHRKSHWLNKVASFTDAWIETTTQTKLRKSDQVASFTDAWIETTYGGSDGTTQCRIFYRCVDWNLFGRLGECFCYVASFTDAWIETLLFTKIVPGYESRIFYRCVDWNMTTKKATNETTVASFTDAWIETRQRYGGHSSR